jgi:prepilin-type N-terminal cleavage/methylation domain-containing protein/prepilin-type processing-associated H-X9-DG protein
MSRQFHHSRRVHKRSAMHLRTAHAFTSSGFTLVEMLVVISIIAILAALLLPAINGAREMARRMSCNNNLRNISLAVQQFDGAKNQYPASRTFINFDYPTKPTTYAGNVGHTLSWVHEILPYIEKQDMRNRIEANFKSASPSPIYNVVSGKLNIVLCPSDETDDSVSPYSPSSSTQPYGQLSYACNVGVTDNYATTAGASAGFDWPQNGVFDNRLKGKAATEIQKIFKTGHADIVNGDGASNTIQFTENSDLEEWVAAPTEIHVGVVWDDLLSGTQLLNKYPAPTPPTPPDTKPDTLENLYTAGNHLAFARPLSNHPSGFVVAFCDGHTKFVSESINYNTYCLLMSSHGKKYKPAGINTPPMPSAYQSAAQLQSQALSDSSF